MSATQNEGDKAVGKMSPLVRICTQRGSVVVNLAVIAMYILLLTSGLFSALPLTCIVIHSQMLKLMRLMN
ncbi:hypothetical protein FEM48_Zijuj09G0190000 [Ziziphus jujuba var. spinosa]|uniref:Uncharacterized protein n=1 Tax=Ziziphus jujuba var. spinosa TaxID=714518 RepID=A0A978UUR5_ZIZJJ|nr:hypothetical protein FEM48_Zijuj09G0190000 [Ziziphus jujuba var. spinosa]